MTLRRRLLVLLMVSVPVIWAIAVGASYLRSRHEINEYFDTQQIRFAQLVLSMLPSANLGESRVLPDAAGPLGEAELEDLSVAVWSDDGRLLLTDHEGATLPFRRDVGFVDIDRNRDRWRIFYLHPDNAPWTIAVGQTMEERDEVLTGLLLGQLLPWLLMLPVLLVAMALAVRLALKPVHAIASEIEHRRVDDLRPVRLEGLPAELKPLVASMNRLFERIDDALEHERRLTADAAHELRTPLAALRAQWEAARVAQSEEMRTAASRQIGAGIERLGRLVEQLLALAAVESRPNGGFTGLVQWRRVVEQAISDCMPLIERTGSEIDVHWPEREPPLAVVGDEALLALLLRNLLDNALRYSPPGSHVTIRVGADRIDVDDEGPGIPDAVRARIGDRFYRPPGQAEPGSGLGVSIVMRVAALHQLDVAFANRAGVDARPRGLRVTLRRARGR